MNEDCKIHKIVNGLWNGTVKLISNPNDGCLACQIGDYWFYFIGSEDENLTPEEAKKNYDVFIIANLYLKRWMTSKTLTKMSIVIITACLDLKNKEKIKQ